MRKHRNYLKKLGPGFITGASDDDPSGIGTYSQTGAQFGYGQLWTALFTFPFMSVIQEMCGRIGLVTGRGLSAIIRTHYARPILYGALLLLVIANTINIGADLGAMAAAGNLLVGDIPFIYWLIGMTVLSLLLQVFVSYRVYSRYLKWLTLSLLAYIITAFVIHIDWAHVLRATLVPSIAFDKDYILNIVAILGTTISPYLFFWQAGEEVEEEVAKHKLAGMLSRRPKISRADIREMRWDTVSGMLFSNVVMFFIIAVTASTLAPHGITHINTADQAAQALRPLAGNFAYVLFAAGIIGTGLLAVPVLAGSASYAIAEAFGWKEGLYRKFRQAHGFYGVITLATLVGLLVNFTPIKPFEMLYYTAVLNGLCAPPLMVLIMLIANNKKIMGSHTNSGFFNILGWIITAVMAAAGGALVVGLVL